MNNENRYAHNGHLQGSNQGISSKLTTLLAVIISFQKKVEILRVKICGHPYFSPELYYKQIDRCEKGYIDTEDMVSFIKKSKPSFNVDHRYLKSLFVRLNQDQRVPAQKLTYFGYLNIIKPYFDGPLARDVLLRDSVAMGTDINLIVKKLLEDLICTIYVCVAEHERIKQLIILGDLQQGGNDPGNLYNIYQLFDIVRKGSQERVSSRIPQPIRSNINIISNVNINEQFENSQIRGNENVDTGHQSQPLSHSSKLKDSNLQIFFNFICNNSEYQIQKQETKYLLAYLMCHEYMLSNQKYLTLLFMPVCATVTIPMPNNLIQKNQINYKNSVLPAGQMNFLGYVHPNLGPQQKTRRKQPIKNQYPLVQKDNPPSFLEAKFQSSRVQKMIDQQPRILINTPMASNSLQTPILQKFLRESKVLKNMSRYRSAIQQQSSESSAFIQQQNYLKRQKRLENGGKYLDPNIGIQHTQKPVNKDFNLQQVLSNSNMHRSEYYQNLSMRAYIQDQPLKPNDFHSPMNDMETSGILNNFLRR